MALASPLRRMISASIAKGGRRRAPSSRAGWRARAALRTGVGRSGESVSCSLSRPLALDDTDQVAGEAGRKGLLFGAVEVQVLSDFGAQRSIADERVLCRASFRQYALDRRRRHARQPLRG